MLEEYRHRIIAEIESTLNNAAPNIRRMANLAADVVASGGVLHILDHGHLLGNEMTARAGGLAVIHAVTLEDARNPVVVRRGDLLFIASVSGRSKQVVEVAIQAKERGVHAVALTSSAQAAVAQPEDPNLGLLRDVAEEVLDIGGVAGDALIGGDGDKACVPGSGVLSVVVMWAVVAELVAALRKRGIEPTIFTSVNVPGGEQSFEKEMARYVRLGY